MPSIISRGCAATWILAVGLFIPTLTATNASAQLINNDPPLERFLWKEGLSPRIHRNKCTICSPSDPNCTTPNRYYGYYYGSRQWIQPFSNMSVIFDVRDPADCLVDLYDGESEVSVVAPGAEFLEEEPDESVGVFRVNETELVCVEYSGGSCIDWEERVIAGDILVVHTHPISGTPMPFSDPSALSMQAEGRAIFVHEFGHFFGLDHSFGTDDKAMSVMRRVVVTPMTGGTPSAVAFPSDMKPFYDMYGAPHNLPNIVVSAHGVTSLGALKVLNTGTIPVCKGSSTTIQMYVGNKSHVPTSFLMEARLGAVAPTGGTHAGFETKSLNAFHEIIFDFDINVPSDEPTGIKSININVDPGSWISEVTRKDNWTISGAKIQVVPC